MLRKISFILFVLLLSAPSYAVDTVGTDSRIRTFIYGKNDVFRVVTSFGYQTTIEFEDDEKLKTIAVGNSGYFRITPLKNKIIVRGLQPNLLTNMSVVSNKRTYQFELSTITNSLDDIMYVVRFYYPEEFSEGVQAPSSMSTPYAQQPGLPNVPEVRIPSTTTSQPMMSPPPAPMPQQTTIPGMNGNFAIQAPSGFNYNYSLTGPEELSPTEVFDDGARTYFKFSNQTSPNFRVLSPAGESAVNYQLSGGYYVVEAIAPEIRVYFGSQKITVYNESYPQR